MPLNVNFGRVLMGEQRMTATRQSVLARWPSVPRQLVESSLRPRTQVCGETGLDEAESSQQAC